MRFTSVRDFQRALERAVRSSGLPIAFSAGFHPHPRISYANAAPTGVASEAEYAELALTAQVDPGELRDRLNATLPDGLDIVAAATVDPLDSRSMADQLQVSQWSIRVEGLAAGALQGAVDRLLARDQLEVARVTTSGKRAIDVRGALVDAVVAAEPVGGCEILHLVVRHTTPTVRPDDVLNALRLVSDLEPATPPVATRLAQGSWDNGAASVVNVLTTSGDAVGD